MKPRFQVPVFLLIILMFLSACSPSENEPAPPVQAQPAVSIAQRKDSVLTPTSQGQDTIVETESGTTPPPTVTQEQPASLTPDLPTPTQNPNETNTNPPPPTDEPISTNTPEESGPLSCSPSDSSAFAAEIIRLINEQRAAAGVPLLTGQTQLTEAAQNHSQDMACSGFFSHTSPTTGTLFDRLASVGYTYSWAGENIAAGQTTPAAVIEAWMASEGHRANILNENFTQIGVGYADWSDSEYGSYWTAVFASP